MIEFSSIELLEYASEDVVHNGLHIYRNGLLCNVNAPNLFALSALCLHDQPFGFTREDVEVLTDAVGSVYSSMEGSAKLLSLADRIEALLPPEEKQ